MKKSFFIVAFAAYAFIACNNGKSADHKHNPDGSHPAEGTHTHDDGSVHKDHDADTTVKQEQFKVGADSASHSHSDSTHKH